MFFQDKLHAQRRNNAKEAINRNANGGCTGKAWLRCATCALCKQRSGAKWLVVSKQLSIVDYRQQCTTPALLLQFRSQRCHATRLTSATTRVHVRGQFRSATILHFQSTFFLAAKAPPEPISPIVKDQSKWRCFCQGSDIDKYSRIIFPLVRLAHQTLTSKAQSRPSACSTRSIGYSCCTSAEPTLHLGLTRSYALRSTAECLQKPQQIDSSLFTQIPKRFLSKRAYK